MMDNRDEVRPLWSDAHQRVAANDVIARYVGKGATLAQRFPIIMKKKNNVGRTRPDDGNAFIPDTTGMARPYPISDADSFGEELICSVTMGESVTEDAMDEVGDEEEGGPFIVLDEHARLPKLVDDENSTDIDGEGHDSIQRESVTRAARWVSHN
jgi:hypothetical protein